MKLIIVAAITLSLCNSCHRNHKLKELVNSWVNREIILPTYLPFKIYGKDTIVSTDFTYKIINYIDTNDCMSCNLKLYEWRQLRNEIKNNRTGIIFIVHANNYDEFETLLRKNRADFLCIYDYDRDIQKLNNFPNKKSLQTFLLDSNNKVLLIGNPIYNEKLRKLYIKTLQNQ